METWDEMRAELIRISPYSRTFEEAKAALVEHKRDAVHKAARELERARAELAKAKRLSQSDVVGDK